MLSLFKLNHVNMTKTGILLCLLPGLLLFTACSSDVSKPTPSVGILLFGDSRQPQVKGFRAGLAELGYADGSGVRYVLHNAKNDRSKLKGLVQDLLDKKVDLMVAAGGLEADTMKRMLVNNKTPVLVLYVNAIIERGLVADRRQPGWAVTGVDNLNAELSGKRVELIQDLVPTAKRILILYYEKIAPSRIGVEKAKEVASKLGLEIDARPVSNRQEIEQVMASLKPGEVDAMLTVPTAPIDNALKKIILPHVVRLKCPLMTHSRPMSEMGALASYGAHFYDMGKQASRLADKLLKGVAPENIPFETPKQFVFTINKDVVDSFDLQLSEVVQSQVNDFIQTSR